MKNAQNDSLLNFNPNPGHGPREIVRQYVGAVIASDQVKLMLSSNEVQAFDVSVLSSDHDIATLTKRSSLISSRLLLAHEPTVGKRNRIEDDWGYENDDENVWTRHVDINCPDLQGLAAWMLDSAPLIRLGRVIYLPTVLESIWNVNAGDYDRENSPIGLQVSQAFDVFLRDGKAATLVDGSRLGSRMLVPLMHLELPFIEGTSMRDFAQIVTDSEDSQEATRDFLRRRLVDLLECETARDLELNAAKLSIEVSEGIREVKAELRKVKRQRAVQAAGGILATAAATLVALDGGVFREILPIIGATGGAWGFTTAMMQGRQEKGQIKERPFYFFWLLERHARGA